MKNLRTYKENGYNYIVVLNGHSEDYNYEVFANRSTAERYNENKFNGYGDSYVSPSYKRISRNF